MTEKIRNQDVPADAVWGVFFPFLSEIEANEVAKEMAVKVGFWGRVVQVPSLLYEEGLKVSPIIDRKGAKP